MIDKLITRLQKVKRTGQDRYIACCPAHDDKSPSLSVTERDGHVIFHCFAGCSPADVLAAVGLEFQDLYPERPAHNKKMAFNAYDVLKCLRSESLIVAIASRQLSRGVTPSHDDLSRIDQAHERIYEACRLMGIK